MAVPISNVTRRQVYAPSGAGGAGPYAFTFEILAATDIAVYKDDVLLTLTTHYTVTINANGTGSVTITATGLALEPTSPTQYAIVGNRTISRSTDFTTGGDFFANVLNDELDQQTIFNQQNAEGLGRALQAPQTDPTSINMTLPRKVFRAGKLLAFNATTGNPEVGPDLTNFSGIYQGAYASAPSTRFDTSTLQAGDLYFDTTSDSMRVYTGSAWQEIAPEMAIGHQAYTATAGQTTFSVTDGYNVNSVYVYKNGTLLDAADYTASNGTSIVLASGAALNDTLRVVTYFNPVDTISIKNAAAASASAAATSASNAANSASAASTSAGNAFSAAVVAGNNATNASASASNAATSAAQAASTYDAFDDRYLGDKSSNPTTDNDGNALLTGALYWNTTSQEMRVYNGTAWVSAYLPGSAYVNVTDNQTIGGVKTFSSNPILSDGTANGLAYLNGSKVLTTGSTLTFDGSRQIRLNFGGYTDWNTGYNTILVGASTVAGAFNSTVSHLASNLTDDTGSGGWRYVLSGSRASVLTQSNGTLTWSATTTTGSGGTSAASFLKPIISANFAGAITLNSSSDPGSLTHYGTATISDAVTLSGGTANGVAYLNGSKVLTSGSALTYNGTTLTADTASTSAANFRIENGSFNRVGAFQLTANGVQFDAFDQNSTSAQRSFMWLSGGSEQMRLTSTGLGIGTSSPGYKLDVSAAANGTALLNLNNTSTSQSNYGIRWTTAGTNAACRNWSITSDIVEYGDFGINQSNARTGDPINAGTTRLLISASGNLGIGTSSPAAKLDVNGGTNSEMRLTTSGSGYLQVGQFTNGAFIGTSSTDATAGILRLGTGGTTRATLDASGNLGLGVTPSAWGTNERALQIGNTLSLFRGGSSEAVLAYNAFVNSSGSYIYNITTNASRYEQLAGQHLWFTAPSGTAGNAISFTQAMTLDASGNLRIGLTSAAYNAERLTVYKSGNAESAAFINDAGANNYTVAVSNRATTGDNKFMVFATESSDTTRGSIVYTRGTGLVTYATTSDYRAKDILGPVQNPGAIIDALKVYEGQMKGATQSRPMLVAHEAQAVVPYAVTGEKDAVNEDGTPKFQQMDVSSLVPLLLAEIQSLRARVAQLEGNQP